MNVNLTYRTVVVPAYTTLPIAQSGSVFFCSAASGNFNLTLDGGETLNMSAGWEINVGDKKAWQRFSLQNPSGTALTVSYYCGTAGVTYASQLNTFFAKNVGTQARGSGVLTLAAGATSAAYTGLLNTMPRKQFIVSNLSGNYTLYVLDSGSNVGLVVPPNQSATFETTDKLYVKNSGGGSATYSVMETFYTS